MILRLVDIVLIVLFGFISIATIEDQVKIELADAHEVAEQRAQGKHMLNVTVDAWGNFYIQGERARSTLEEVEYFIQTKLDSIPVNDDMPVHLRIRADKAASMGQIRRISSLCDQLGIEKSLVVRRVDGE